MNCELSTLTKPHGVTTCHPKTDFYVGMNGLSLCLNVSSADDHSVRLEPRFPQPAREYGNNFKQHTTMIWLTRDLNLALYILCSVGGLPMFHPCSPACRDHAVS